MEHGKTAGAPETLGTVIGNVLGPGIRIAQGEQHLRKVLHVLLAVLEAGRESVFLLVASRVAPDILLRKVTYTHPVRILLALRTEGRTYAHPVFLNARLVDKAHNVAKAVVGAAFERAVAVGLLSRTVNNLGQVRNGRDGHIHLRPGRTALFGIGKGSHLFLRPGVGGRILIDGIHTHQAGKTFGGRSGGVAEHDAGLRIRLVRNTNHRLKGFAFVVCGVVRGGYKLAHHVPELVGFFCPLLLFFGLLLLRA